MRPARNPLEVGRGTSPARQRQEVFSIFRKIWRLEEARTGAAAWRRWGTYLSERAWGTVREDYSEWGTCWEDFPHDHARSRAYRWGEDGLAGISDNQSRLCLSLALSLRQDIQQAISGEQKLEQSMCSDTPATTNM